MEGSEFGDCILPVLALLGTRPGWCQLVSQPFSWGINRGTFSSAIMIKTIKINRALANSSLAPLSRPQNSGQTANLLAFSPHPRAWEALGLAGFSVSSWEASAGAHSWLTCTRSCPLSASGTGGKLSQLFSSCFPTASPLTFWGYPVSRSSRVGKGGSEVSAAFAHQPMAPPPSQLCLREGCPCSCNQRALVHPAGLVPAEDSWWLSLAPARSHYAPNV